MSTARNTRVYCFLARALGFREGLSLRTQMGYLEFWEKWELGPELPRTLPYYTNAVGTPTWGRTNGARILGISCYRPDRQPFEQFYYHHLITTKPFRNIKHLITQDNLEATYARQCEIEQVFGDPEDRPAYLQGVLRAVDTDLRRGKVITGAPSCLSILFRSLSSEKTKTVYPSPYESPRPLDRST